MRRQLELLGGAAARRAPAHAHHRGVLLEEVEQRAVVAHQVAEDLQRAHLLLVGFGGALGLEQRALEQVERPLQRAAREQERIRVFLQRKACKQHLVTSRCQQQALEDSRMQLTNPKPPFLGSGGSL